jgi:RecA-family ATPase
VHYEHQGDFDKAVRAYGLEISPAKAEIELPENGMDDFDYVAPQAAQEAPASAQADDIDLDSFDTPDAPEAAPDWPTVYDMFDGASIEPRRWIYGNHYLRSFVSVLASAGGIGKTSLQIVEALAIVTGRPLLGEEVKERTNVWIVNLEDPLEEIQRRVIAAMQHYKITPDEVRGRLFVNAGRDFSLKFGIQTRDGVLPNTKLVEYLCKQIPQKQIGCVFIDPFVGAHSINENDNMAVNAIVAEIRRVADETKCAIGLVHHIRKGNGEDASIDSVRGAGSLIGAARAARVVNRMSPDDAARLGIDETEARSIFRVDDGKANLAPPAAAAVYRKMHGVQIENGEWIGVTIDFKLPDAFDGIGAKDAKRIQQIVAEAHSNGEPLKESSQSPNWVGVAVANMLDIDISDKKGRSKVGAIVRTWLRTNVLTTEKVFDKKKGREMPVIVVGEWINGDEI